MNSGPPWPQALLEVCLCSGPLTQLIVGGLLLLLGVAPGPEGRLTLSFVAGLALLDTVLLVGLIFSLLRFGGESPRQVLLGSRPVRGEVARGLWLLPSALMIFALTALAIAKWAPGLFPAQNPFAGLAATRGGLIVFALTVMLAGGVREEIQRAFILHRCEQRLGGAIVGVIGFGIVFGAAHYLQGGSAMIITGLLGTFWSVVYLMRRSVVAPMVSHAAFDLLQVIGFGLKA
jgi:membrane protease YdiL (CAAX protease family)